MMAFRHARSSGHISKPLGSLWGGDVSGSATRYEARLAEWQTQRT